MKVYNIEILISTVMYFLTVIRGGNPGSVGVPVVGFAELPGPERSRTVLCDAFYCAFNTGRCYDNCRLSWLLRCRQRVVMSFGNRKTNNRVMPIKQLSLQCFLCFTVFPILHNYVRRVRGITILGHT